MSFNIKAFFILVFAFFFCDLKPMVHSKELPTLCAVKPETALYPAPILQMMQEWQKEVLKQQPQMITKPLLFKEGTAGYIETFIHHVQTHTNAELFSVAACSFNTKPLREELSSGLEETFKKAHDWAHLNKKPVILNMKDIFRHDSIEFQRGYEPLYQALYDVIERYKSPYILVVAYGEHCPEMNNDRCKNTFTMVDCQNFDEQVRKNYFLYALRIPHYESAKRYAQEFLKNNPDYSYHIVDQATKILKNQVEEIDACFKTMSLNSFDESKVAKLDKKIIKALKFMEYEYSSYFCKHVNDYEPSMNEKYVQLLRSVLCSIYFNLHKYAFTFQTKNKKLQDAFLEAVAITRTFNLYELDAFIVKILSLPLETNTDGSILFVIDAQKIKKIGEPIKYELKDKPKFIKDRFFDPVEERKQQRKAFIQKIVKMAVYTAIAAATIKVSFDYWRKWVANKKKLKNKEIADLERSVA